jgi:predicted carbohydrate-binding protein with CBM5 and CBM33 domain
MARRRRLAAVAVGVAILPLLLVIVPASPASAHGWVTSPPSRQDHCATRRMSNCGDIQYEPQSVEAQKGARSCSGGSRFGVLDNDSLPWPVTGIGSSVTIQWRLTAAHVTSRWLYYVDGRLHQTFNGGNVQPDPATSHRLTGLPGGRHKLLAVWEIGDTPMAFYNCIDVNVGGGGSLPPPNPPPPPGPTCTPWDRTAVYTGGMMVSHRGSGWRAKWWTQGEEPGTSGEWGVWAPANC